MTPEQLKGWKKDILVSLNILKSKARHAHPDLNYNNMDDSRILTTSKERAAGSGAIPQTIWANSDGCRVLIRGDDQIPDLHPSLTNSSTIC